MSDADKANKGITNTISELSEYFEKWHESKFGSLHERLSGATQSLNHNYEILDSELSTLKDDFDLLKSQYNGLTQGLSSNITISSLDSRITSNTSSINNVNTSITNKLSAWSYVDIATYDSQCIKGYVNPNLRLVFAYVSDVFVYKTSKSNQYIATKEIVKAGYRPKYTVTFASHTPWTTGKIATDGKIYGKSTYPNNNDSMNLYGSCLWVY